MRRYIIDKNKVFGMLNCKDAKNYIGKRGYFTSRLYGRSSDEIVEFYFDKLLSIPKEDELSGYVYKSDDLLNVYDIFIPQENVEIVIDDNSSLDEIVEYKVFQFLKSLKGFTDITKYISFEDVEIEDYATVAISGIHLTQNDSLILRLSCNVKDRNVEFNKAYIKTESISIDEEFEKLKKRYERCSEFVKTINENLKDLNKSVNSGE